MKILFIGLGSIGQRHLRILNTFQIKNSKIYAYRQKNKKIIISNNLKSSFKGDIVKKHELIQLYTKREIENLKPDLTFICNPSAKHIEFAILVAKLQSDIFIEKPISNNLKGMKELVNLVKKNKLICTVGYQMRFHPLIEDLKKSIVSNKYGKLLSIKCNFGHYLPFWHKYEDYKKVIYGKKKLGGGIILEMSHELDYLNWLIEGKIIKQKSLFSKITNLKIDVEDIFHSLIIFKKNNHKILVNLSLDFIQSVPERTTLFIFENNLLKLDLIKNTLEINNISNKKNGIKKIKNFDRDILFKKQLKNFLLNIKNRTQPKVTLKESFELVNFISKIKKQKNNEF